jgi:hypothetical protein
MTMSRTRHRWRHLVAVVAVVALATAASQVAVAPAHADPAGTTIMIDRAHPFGGLPADFVGLSYEMRELATLCTSGTCAGGFDARHGNLVPLLRNLGRSNVRIAGNQLDRDTLWVPAGQAPPDPLPSWVTDVVTPADIARLDQLLRATGWQAEVGINLAHYDPALAADEARSLSSILGPRLAGAECGNEPNHYASNGYRPAPYGFAEHKQDWEACADLMNGERIAAPDISSPTSTAAWFSHFAQAEKDRIAMLTVHNYTGAKTIDQLLSPQVRASELDSVSAELAAAQSVQVPIRVDETNSAVGGGIAGVSDVYASSLWAMDYSLVLAQAGFSGVNFHGGFGVCGAPLYNGKFQLYTPICAANTQDQQAKIFKAMPEYYGLYMATRMKSGHFLPVTVSSDRNVSAYAVRGDDGRLRIAVIEKDATTGAAVPVSVNVGGTIRTASVLRLTGRSLDSTDGVAVQGTTVDAKGHLDPGASDRVPVHHGTVNLTVPSGSAMVITLDDCV